MLSEGHHQAILFDHAMPGMNGELLLKTVCADFPGVAAVAVTQPGELRHGVLAMLAGASGYIQSPLRPEVMTANLRTALTKKWLDSAVRSQYLSVSALTGASQIRQPESGLVVQYNVDQ
jgi:DNA-binding NarL/FixJ family response regulator